jgi:hypothetical protein
MKAAGGPPDLCPGMTHADPHDGTPASGGDSREGMIVDLRVSADGPPAAVVNRTPVQAVVDGDGYDGGLLLSSSRYPATQVPGRGGSVGSHPNRAAAARLADMTDLTLRCPRCKRTFSGDHADQLADALPFRTLTGP